VWFAVATALETRALRRDFGPLGRAEVRARSVQVALELLAQTLRS
jgi:nicotinamide mononucleotide (NMN) deamidase PncC